MAHFAKVAEKSEIREGSSRCVEVEDKRIAVFNSGGQFFAINDTCTHARGPLSEGTVEGDQVTCPWHGATFDLKTGECTGPPAYENVDRYNVRINGDDVEVEV